MDAIVISNYVKEQLATNPQWAQRAIVRLYERQTSDEQCTQSTSHRNGMGFSGCDANILSSFAEQINRGRTLSAKQLAIAYKKLPKYVKQIVECIPQDKLEQLQQKIEGSAV